MVKIRLGNKSLYLTIIKELKVDTNLTRIRNKLKLSKQQLNYYLRRLKINDIIIQKGIGWYEVNKKSKNSTKYGIFFKKDTIRGHAYIWNIELTKIPEDWNKRIEILKKKHINFKLVGAKETTPRIKALGRKVWLCNNHLRIFDIKGSSYYGENARKSRTKAIKELLLIVGVLERKLGIYLKPFKYSFRKEHYALIKNDLAIDQNRKGIIMRIKDENGEEFLLIDDSLEQGGELENVGKKAFQTNIPMQKWWNDHKKNNFKVTPTFLLERMNQVTQNQVMFDKNFQSHLEILKKLGFAVDDLRKEIKNLNKTNEI